MKRFFLVALLLSAINIFSQEKQSEKRFEPIALVNKIDFFDSNYNQAKFSCGFLLKYKSDTLAITAKHLLKFIKTESMKTLTFNNQIKGWSLYRLDHPDEIIVCAKLLNENSKEYLNSKTSYDEDWLAFSIQQNSTKVKPLEIRSTALIPGEKLYVVGWIRTMENGPQRVYEFEYFKSIGNRILLKELIATEKLGGLSGGPVIDEEGLVVAIVSGSSVDPETNQKYFSPCAITGLVSYLDKLQKSPD